MGTLTQFGRGYLGGSTGALPRILGNQDPINSTTLTVTAATSYAYYVGRTGQALSALDLVVYISGTPAAGAGYCELAIAKSGPWSALAASVDLTILGYASIDAEVKGGATQTIAKTISGIAIGPLDDLWVVVAGSHATTQATFRVASADGDRSAVGRRRANCQPSANLNTPLAFAYTAGQTMPHMYAQVTS